MRMGAGLVFNAEKQRRGEAEFLRAVAGWEKSNSWVFSNWVIGDSPICGYATDIG